MQLSTHLNVTFLPLFSSSPAKTETILNRDLQSLNHLVILPGHAVLNKLSFRTSPENDEVWQLLDYQLNHDLGVTLVDQIKNAIDFASKDPKSLLVFSGGQTRPNAVPISEALSYYSVVEYYNWWEAQEVSSRTVLEEYARDSFENLLFSIARFYEVTNSYPDHITIVGYGFKKKRFLEQHAPAIKWPKEKISYIGIDPLGKRFDHEAAINGELKHSVEPFQKDPYGCKSTLLSSKRSARNPYFKRPPYELSVPEMSPLLNWCEISLFHGSLPWDKYN